MAGVSIRVDKETSDKVDNNTFPVHPEGNYRVKVTECEAKEYNGKAKLFVKAEILLGPGKSTELVGKNASQFYDQGAASWWKTGPFLEACGIEITKDEDGAGSDFDTDDLIGSELIVQMKIKEYDGKESNEWKNPQPAPKAAPAEVAKPAAAAKAAPATPAAAKGAKGASAGKSLD